MNRNPNIAMETMGLPRRTNGLPHIAQPLYLTAEKTDLKAVTETWVWKIC